MAGAPKPPSPAPAKHRRVRPNLDDLCVGGIVAIALGDLAAAAFAGVPLTVSGPWSAPFVAGLFAVIGGTSRP